MMSIFKRDLGLIATESIVGVFLSDLIGFFSVGKGMGIDQINDTAMLIVEKYWNWKPEDFKLCYKWAKMGRLGGGKIFDRVDGQIIMGWMDEYEGIKESEIITLREKEKGELMNGQIDPKVYNSIFEKLNEQNISTKNHELRGNKWFEVQKRLMNVWYAQFDRRHDKKRFYNGKLKYILIKNQIYTLHDWLNLKAEKIFLKLELQKFCN